MSDTRTLATAVAWINEHRALGVLREASMMWAEYDDRPDVWAVGLRGYGIVVRCNLGHTHRTDPEGEGEDAALDVALWRAIDAFIVARNRDISHAR